jgi:hypothetical protein
MTPELNIIIKQCLQTHQNTMLCHQVSWPSKAALPKGGWSCQQDEHGDSEEDKTNIVRSFLYYLTLRNYVVALCVCVCLLVCFYFQSTLLPLGNNLLLLNKNHVQFTGKITEIKIYSLAIAQMKPYIGSQIWPHLILSFE